MVFCFRYFVYDIILSLQIWMFPVSRFQMIMNASWIPVCLTRRVSTLLGPTNANVSMDTGRTGMSVKVGITYMSNWACLSKINKERYFFTNTCIKYIEQFIFMASILQCVNFGEKLIIFPDLKHICVISEVASPGYFESIGVPQCHCFSRLSFAWYSYTFVHENFRNFLLNYTVRTYFASTS